ncbi:hypothetical protein FPOAC2_03735 [Fusarium poae]
MAQGDSRVPHAPTRCPFRSGGRARDGEDEESPEAAVFQLPGYQTGHSLSMCLRQLADLGQIKATPGLAYVMAAYQCFGTTSILPLD